MLQHTDRGDDVVLERACDFYRLIQIVTPQAPSPIIASARPTWTSETSYPCTAQNPHSLAAATATGAGSKIVIVCVGIGIDITKRVAAVPPSVVNIMPDADRPYNPADYSFPPRPLRYRINVRTKRVRILVHTVRWPQRGIANRRHQVSQSSVQQLAPCNFYISRV